MSFKKTFLRVLFFVGFVVIVFSVVSCGSDNLDGYDIWLLDKTVAYTGEEESIEIDIVSGKLPDGVSVSYTYDGNYVDGETDIGTYAVRAIFTIDPNVAKGVSMTNLSATLTIVGALVDNWKFSINSNDDTMTLRDYIGSDTDVITPSIASYEGTTYSVTDIDEYCFSNNADITSAVISDGVECLGNDCFLDCVNLESVTLGSDVESVGDSCFSGCTSLANVVNVAVNSSLLSIGEKCYENCTSLTSITLSPTITSIGRYCFLGCTSLNSVRFYGDTDWYVSTTEGSTDTAISNLSNEKANATYLTDTYSEYYWTKVSE